MFKFFKGRRGARPPLLGLEPVKAVCNAYPVRSRTCGVTFLAAQRNRPPSAGTKLYSFVIAMAQGRQQLAQRRYTVASRPAVEPVFSRTQVHDIVHYHATLQIYI